MPDLHTQFKNQFRRSNPLSARSNLLQVWGEHSPVLHMCQKRTACQFQCPRGHQRHVNRNRPSLNSAARPLRPCQPWCWRNGARHLFHRCLNISDHRVHPHPFLPSQDAPRPRGRARGRIWWPSVVMATRVNHFFVKITDFDEIPLVKPSKSTLMAPQRRACCVLHSIVNEG